LFDFDAIGPELELLPLAARRTLDHAGIKLSRITWQALPFVTRQELTNLGSAERIDVNEVRRLLQPVAAVATSVDVVGDPSPGQVPELVSTALGPERPIPLASWAALEPLARYALFKVASSGRPERIEGAYRELIGHSAVSSHLEPSGGVRMVNVGGKQPSLRTARAQSQVKLNQLACQRLAARDVPKGDVFGTARLAGIMAAKKTSDWIPLCHPLALTRISVDLELDTQASVVRIEALVEAFDKTGVEMEALVAASAAALTVYDMLKSFDRGMQIGPTELLSKSGGRTGDYER
jgi:cyclic pyranopterin phosphate synthase